MIIRASEPPQLDAHRIGTLFLQGFHGKFEHFGFTPTEARLSADLLGDYLLTFYAPSLIVAVPPKGGPLNGCLLLNQGQTLGQRTFKHRLGQVLPGWSGLKLLLFLQLLDQPASPAQPVVDFIAVDPLTRHQGIGTALLRYCQAHTTQLTLNVAATNPTAHRLYYHLGFCDRQTQHSWLTQRFLGFDQWTTMDWGNQKGPRDISR
ncbi:GNAT family N-acetyltransferase [Levilactobacillus acidifarinae]|uniref:N-acetyltransferase domain-containing protein n=1 Tax=Levilactobacillus acidifarinae DSM 19394 = JCM 15949 TaxID=1423715 RepID=A0A0R1LJD5_9LACO|nr:GNAT family N-acetyltransferase [Levilactobacillus acidifarinae]KRK95672.1 hypothetical protein FD25_GL000087 [Levilactobacillus acidifarinae DSM 19394]GEO69408.1 hypothetical protein LAC03_13180 [Levilactobacillus acidifarinae]